ncbi:uncharacterized protein LOC111391577, partial [Olea europaea var. sylvestris]|uniref:uncharacterized protein LOC111391577 n=1 Tax=Olea europaea var. sylvestris TaxID=158386 RepID=UPI000C1D60B1
GERIGRHPRPLSVMGEFNACPDNCGLVEMREHGRHMSWCNGRIGQAWSWAKLDRVVKEPKHKVGLRKLAAKLREKKGKTVLALQSWNKQVFGHVTYHIKELEEKVEMLEKQWQSRFVLDLEAKFLTTKKREKLRLAAQAKKKWLIDGDQNLKFFHSVVNQQKRTSQISSMQLPDGTVLASPKEWRRVVEPTEKEVKDAIFSIPSKSSPGPNGFGAGFYTSCWDLVKVDMVEAGREFSRDSPYPYFTTPLSLS